MYRRDLILITTTVVAELGSGDPLPSGPLDVSDDGSVVAYPGFVLGGARRAFVLDGAGPLAEVGSAENSNPRLAGDGRFVVADGYRYDRVASSAVPVVASGPAGTDVVLAMTRSARHVLFSTSRPGLDPSDTNAVDDLYVGDLQTGDRTRVTVGGGLDGFVPTGGWALNEFPVGPSTVNVRYPLASISDDATRIAFITDAPDVTGGTPTTGWHTYVADIGEGAVQHVTADHDALARWQAWGGRFLSSDGRRAVLQGSRDGVAGVWSHPVG